MLADDVQGSPARDDHRRSGRRPDDRRHVAGGLEHLLEVVEDDDHRATAEIGDQGIDRGALRPVEQADPMGDRRGDLRRIGHVGEGHEPGTVRVPRRELSGGFDGQARLADAAGPGQGDQPGRAGQLGDRGQLRVTAEEARQATGQVAAHAPRRAQRREVRRQAVDRQLIERLGTGHITQEVATQVHEPGAGRGAGRR